MMEMVMSKMEEQSDQHFRPSFNASAQEPKQEEETKVEVIKKEPVKRAVLPLPKERQPTFHKKAQDSSPEYSFECSSKSSKPQDVDSMDDPTVEQLTFKRKSTKLTNNFMKEEKIMLDQTMQREYVKMGGKKNDEVEVHSEVIKGGRERGKQRLWIGVINN